MNQPFDLCFPVLTPFKFRGVIVKPPAFVQMPREEARPYFYAGVIGAEEDSALVPDAEAEAQRLADEQADADAKAAEDASKAAAAAAGSAATTRRGTRKPNG